MSEKIVRDGNVGVMSVPDAGAVLFSIGASTSDNFSSPQGSFGKVSWEAEPERIAGKRIVPYGVSNELPTEIRNIMDENSLAPGILEREIGLLWGQGPQLYKEVFEDGDFKREWVRDSEVWDWLQGWSFERYLLKVVTEFKFLKGHFSKFYRNRGVRIGGTGRIARLECVPGTDARLEWAESRRLEDVRHVFTGDWENDCKGGVKSFNVFDRSDIRFVTLCRWDILVRAVLHVIFIVYRGITAL